MKLRTALLRWFDRNARDLPFRHTHDPYAIWVSEVMLQQTRVHTVLRYYESFLTRFPTPHALACASEDEVMSQWSGLGYYRRARLLHRGAKDLVAIYGGEMPTDPTQRLKLPGIGKYTSGAIGSIAFDQPEALVDGNVARVYSRLFTIDTPLGRSDTEKALWAKAEELVQGPRPGTFNQAVMELGATLCAKHNPECGPCPVQKICQARIAERTAELPVVKPKKPPRPTPLVALLASHPTQANSIWLHRGEEALFGGLWNLPFIETKQMSDEQAARSLMNTLGLKGRPPKAPSVQFQHVLTHRRLEVSLYQLQCTAVPKAGLQPVNLDQLSTIGISSLTQKALQQTHGVPHKPPAPSQA